MPYSRSASRFIILALCAAGIAACATSPSAVDAISQPLLLGMQLSERQAERVGAASSAHNACIQALTPSAFYKVVEEVMSAALTPEQIATTNLFFNTPAGRKYLKYDLLRSYLAVGEKPPEAPPEFSDAEVKDVRAFAATSAGSALITRKVMLSQSAQKAYESRVVELNEACNAQ